LKEFIKHNRFFYGFYLLVILVSAYYLLNYDKLMLHQFINYFVGNKAVDGFYKYFTHVGDGVFAVIIGVLVLIKNVRQGLFVLVSYAIAGGLASIIKWSVNYTRPHHVFSYYKKHIDIRYVDGVEMIGEHSFPSGHSTAAFSVFTALALSTKNQFLKLVYLFIALNAAFSRTYLSQHWLVDITAGSLIGVTFATLLYFLVYCNKNIVAKFDRPLISPKAE
jgi:membrane-associated phospholipid phosphatase